MRSLVASFIIMAVICIRKEPAGINFKRILCLFFAALLLTGCSAAPAEIAQTTETTKGSDLMLSKDRTYNILFIGNSYTFYNNMPTTFFEPMAKVCGYDVRVTAITKGAYTLEKFADPTDAYGKLVHTALSASGSFDYVILQEQSVRPAVASDAFYAAVRTLAEKIRAVGAQPILFATWGRQTVSETLTKYELTNETMTYRLADAYASIGKELDIPVMHVGLAFYDINSNNSSINLYNNDLSHPSSEGSYLAAMTLFCGIFGVDPVTAPFSGPLSAEEDPIVRAAVAKALQSPQIPEAEA